MRQYDGYQERVRSLSYDAAVTLLRAELPQLWLADYDSRFSAGSLILIVDRGHFRYWFDHAQGVASDGSMRDSRVVAVLGLSSRPAIARESSRLRGWVGPTDSFFGPDYDKGHFMAHSMGGLVDTWEINVFPQLREVNRGWSRQGKLYRSMEKYCALNVGTFCFFRPHYRDLTNTPASYEFGVLKADKELWVEQFSNLKSS